MDNLIVIFIILGLAAIIGGIIYLQKKTNFYWKMVGRSKWRELQPEIQNIREIHERATGAGKKINWVDKKVFKSSQKSFDSSKEKYFQYIDFCRSKHLQYPDDHNEFEDLIERTEFALLDPNEALDRELELTQQCYDKTYKIVSDAGEKLFFRRQEAVRVIDRVEDLVNSISRYPKAFETDIREINLQKEQFKDAIVFGLEQQKAFEMSAKSAGAGVAAGAAVASMAPAAAMWVATTFGTASTGTAISALSGAAATNAALAWLGGGALAAGGGGMAAGQAFLALAGPIGWGVAGTSLGVSVWLAWRKKHKIQESKRDEIARMKQWIEALKETKGQIDVISIKTASLNE